MNFYSKKNELDDDINEEREKEQKEFIGQLLKEENEDNNELENENIELNHSSNFINKSIRLDKINIKNSSSKPKNDLIEFSQGEENDEEEEDSDLDSIEELFRKSCVGLKELTSEIQ